MRSKLASPPKCLGCTSGMIHVTASLHLEWRAFEEYCTEYGVLPTLDQLQSWSLEQMVLSNELSELLTIKGLTPAAV